MMRLKEILFGLLVCTVIYSCSPAEGNKPGHEYMPDMAHSIAYEANIDNYYYYHTWGNKEDYHNLSKPRNPVHGTIARGSGGNLTNDSTSQMKFHQMMDGSSSENAIKIPGNGHVNYYYNNTEDERLRASKEITSNALPITKNGLAQGKQLYNVYCGICHGEKGDGAGYLVRDNGGVYPAQPANFMKDDFIAASEGRFYHGIMYGRNVMNGYADKLSYEERWNVIHYIRSLQAASKNLKYDEKENTFSNSQIRIDAAKAVALTAAVSQPPADPKTNKK